MKGCCRRLESSEACGFACFSFGGVGGLPPLSERTSRSSRAGALAVSSRAAAAPLHPGAPHRRDRPDGGRFQQRAANSPPTHARRAGAPPAQPINSGAVAKVPAAAAMLNCLQRMGVPANRSGPRAGREFSGIFADQGDFQTLRPRRRVPITVNYTVWVNEVPSAVCPSARVASPDQDGPGPVILL
jgi:hypothetical protein